MAHDIFKLFKKSIEPVMVTKVPRGTFDIEEAEFTVTVDAIVKRRNLMAGSVENSEDYSNNTTVHFRQEDAEYIEVGNYVKIDNQWHSILPVKDGKDFDQGKTKFLYVFLNTDVATFTKDPVWGQSA